MLYSFATNHFKSGISGKPTVPELMSSLQATNNQHLKGVSEFLFKFCFPLFLFRSGVRQCNFEVALKARECSAAVFYAFNHPKYQKINCVDIAELLQVPVNIRPFVYSESFRIPHSHVGQGIDFLLEQRNRQLKAFVVHDGVPTTEQWTNASRALPVLEEVCYQIYDYSWCRLSLLFLLQIVDGVEKRLNIPKAYEPRSRITLEDEKLEARKYFRESMLLDFSSQQPLLYTNTKPVPNVFLNCSYLAEENRISYYTDYVNKGTAKITSITKSQEPVVNFDKWTVAKLRAEIKIKVLGICETERKQFTKGLYNDRKDALIAKYGKLSNMIEDAENVIETIDDDDALDMD